MRLLSLVTAVLCLNLAMAAIAPVISRYNDTGNGTAILEWSSTPGAADYLVSAEAFSFQETLPGGSLTPGGATRSKPTLCLYMPPRYAHCACTAWQCVSPSCANGGNVTFTTAFPGNVTMNMSGVVLCEWERGTAVCLFTTRHPIHQIATLGLRIVHTRTRALR